MNKKMWLAGLVAGVVMFIWGAIAHAALPIGEMYVSTTPGEETVLTAAKTNMNAPGFYMLPGDDLARSRKLPKDQQAAARKTFEDKWNAGPRAIMVYSSGPAPSIGLLLGREFLPTLVAAFIITFALVSALPTLRSFASRVLFVTLIGLLPLLVVDLSLWNWYEFPNTYVISESLDYVVGALLAGIFLAWFYRKEGATRESMAKAA